MRMCIRSSWIWFGNILFRIFHLSLFSETVLWLYYFFSHCSCFWVSELRKWARLGRGLESSHPLSCRLSFSRKGAWFGLQGWLPSPQRPQQVPQRGSQGAWAAWLRSTVPPRGFRRASSGCPVRARGRSQSTAFACHLLAGGGSPLWDLLSPPSRGHPRT